MMSARRPRFLWNSSCGWASSACMRRWYWASDSPGDAPKVAVGLRVGLDVEALRAELAQVLPRQRVAPRPDVVGVHEERGREAELLQHRIGVLAERLVAVVEGQHHRPLRKLAAEPRELHELAQADHPVAVGLEVLHLLPEASTAAMTMRPFAWSARL